MFLENFEAKNNEKNLETEPNLNFRRKSCHGGVFGLLTRKEKYITLSNCNCFTAMQMKKEKQKVLKMKIQISITDTEKNSINFAKKNTKMTMIGSKILDKSINNSFISSKTPHCIFF